MLEGIVQIGRALLEGSSLLDNLIREVEAVDKKGNPLHIMKLNFKKDGIEIDVSKEMEENSARELVFVGSADGPSSPQWLATSKSINYFLTEVFYNLTNMDFGQELNDKIKYVFENFYTKVSDEIKSFKYKYALDMGKWLDPELDVKTIYEEMKKEGKQEKDIVKELTKAFETYIKEKKGIKLNEIGLFTISIDDELLVKRKEYQEKVLEAKSPKGNEKKKGGLVCSICGSTENVTSDLSKMKIKYYTTNQVIFASGLDLNNYYKNMLACENCLNSIISAEVYMENNLKTKLGDLTVYILPHFIHGEPLNKEELDHAVEKLNKSFNTARNMEDIKKFEFDILESLELKDDDSYFLINFMFVKQANQSTKIQRLIKDVPPNIFSKIAASSKASNQKMKEALGLNYRMYIGLNNIYYLIPVKSKKGEVTEYRDLLNIYDAIFTSRNINKSHLIDKFIDAVNVIRLKKEGYNIKEESIEFYVLNATMLLKFFENMKCIKEGKGLDVSVLNVKDEIKNFINKMQYDEQQTAMFLLGILIGEIGNSQYKRYDGKKPILNKLNFNGMDLAKLIRLSNEVYTKLEQEKIRGFNEVTYADFKKLFDSNMNNWNLNKNENLFYILSGYSYSSTQPILREVRENEQQ